MTKMTKVTKMTKAINQEQEQLIDFQDRGATCSRSKTPGFPVTSVALNS